MRRLFLLSNILIILLTSCSAQKVAVENNKFEWWSIYSPDRKGVNIDNDWALWGHNIRKAIPMEEALKASTSDGKKTEEQYCFSSEKLYDKLCQYISDNGGKDFTIAPLDNNIVCQCAGCRKAGNTAVSATPAVWSLLQRLSKKFPTKRFFTIAYKTCEEPGGVQGSKDQGSKSQGSKVQGSKVGIFLSAVKLPMRRLFKDTQQFKRFDAQLQNWKNATDLIYIWEYNRNYDDYFTPYPCLRSLQDRLTYYRQEGVRGIFVNDSGDCYASFGDIQAAVLAKMLAATAPIDIDKAVTEYCTDHYPISGKQLSSWYLAMEKTAYDRDHAMQFYAGIDDAVHCWLVPSDFETQWLALDKLCKKTEKPERQNLSTLLTALCLSRAELLRSKTPTDSVKLEDVLEVLDEYKDNKRLQTYNEAEHKTEDYLKKARSKKGSEKEVKGK